MSNRPAVSLGSIGGVTFGAVLVVIALFGSASPLLGLLGLIAMVAPLLQAIRALSVDDDESQRVGNEVDVDEAAVREQLLASLDIALVVYRGEAAVYSNAAARRTLGRSHLRVTTLMPRSARSVVERVISDGGDGSARFEVGFPVRIVELSAHALDGGIVGVWINDVTDQERADVVRRDFVAAASHELKTPAASILAASETVLAAIDDDPTAARDFAGRVHDNAVRLARIVSDLLDLSRLEFGGGEWEVFDLADAARAELDHLPDRTNPVEVDLASVRMHGDRSDVQLAIRNLLDNAMRHTQPSGRIAIRVNSADSATALVEVSDTGIGIPRNDQGRVFERFYRVDDGRSRATGGTGLGLAIVKHVAEQHGGSVDVESEVGVGSTFSLRFPILKEDRVAAS